jgi:hypothetical protein
MALQAPIDRHTHLALRAAVLELREGERRQRFPARLHAGLPGPTCPRVTVPAGAGSGLRADLAVALLARGAAQASRPCVWLTRPGELAVEDADLEWGWAVRWAAGALGRTDTLVVVTRRGWFDPVSGVRREWRRLRRHAPGG